MSNGDEEGRDDGSQDSDSTRASRPERGRRDATANDGTGADRQRSGQQGRPDQRRDGPRGQQQAQPRQGPGRQAPNRQGQPRSVRQAGQQQRGRPQGAPGQAGRPPGRQAGGIDFGDLPWKSGILNGLVTFVAGFIAIGILLFVDVALSSSGSPTGGGMGSTAGDELFYAVGWIFYNAHFVDITAGGQSVNLLGMLGGFTTIPTLVYYVIPAGLLVASGRSVGRKVGPRAPDGERAAAGASLLAGYLPLAVVGSVVLTMEVSGGFGTTASVGPDTTTAVLIAGLAYPVIFGGLGGYLSN